MVKATIVLKMTHYTLFNWIMEIFYNTENVRAAYL